MAKKGFGKLVAAAAVAGAAAAGISYLKKYKSFNDELEEDFHDFEGEDEKDDLFEDEETVILPDTDDEGNADEIKKAAPADDSENSEPQEAEPQAENHAEPKDSRKYISLSVNKEELKLAAKDMVAAAGEFAGAAKNVLKDAAVILGDTALEAAAAAKDTAQIARTKMNERMENYKNRQNEESADDSSEDSDDADKPEGTDAPEAEKAEASENTDAEKADLAEESTTIVEELNDDLP